MEDFSRVEPFEVPPQVVVLALFCESYLALHCYESVKATFEDHQHQEVKHRGEDEITRQVEKHHKIRQLDSMSRVAEIEEAYHGDCVVVSGGCLAEESEHF